MEKFEPKGFSNQIFKERYAFTPEESWDEACLRVADQMAKAEGPDKYAKYKEKFYTELVMNRFVPGGRIWYSSGRPIPTSTLRCTKNTTTPYRRDY